MNDRAPRITFVLPVYDEEESLSELHRRIVAAMEPRQESFEMLFVDDGSSDHSFERLSELRQLDRRVRVIQFRRNFGKAAAYSAGFDNARGEIVITLDTDLQDDPAEIPLFIEKLEEGFDMVVGWKFEGKGGMEKSLPSRFFNWVVRRITGIPLNDFNCPFKAYRKSVLAEIQVYGELHRYIPVLAHSRGFSLTQIKIKNLPRLAGRSKYGIERYLRGMLDLLTISFITRFAKRPMHLLGIGGILACIAGALTLIVLAVMHVLYLSGEVTSAWAIRDRPAISLGVLLLVVGVQFLSLGLLGELVVTKSTHERHEQSYSIRRILGD